MKDIIFKRLKGLIIKSILNYKNSDSYFVFVSNILLKLNNKNHRFEKSDLGDLFPKFKIVDSLSNQFKFFNYRKQGLMAFENGIAERGVFIGKEYLIDKIKFFSNDLIIDVGANTGDFKIFFDNKDIKVNYFGFEPGLIEFECLKLNNPLSNIFRIALGKSDKRSVFYYKPEFGDSSLVEMKDFSKSYEVNEMKLSTFLKDNELKEKKIKLIKLESEGFEPEILIGLGDYLKNIEYISADVGFERGINQDTTAPQVLNYLINSGFEIIRVNSDRFVFLLKNKHFNN